MIANADQRLTVLLVEDNPGDARLIHESLADSSRDAFNLEIADKLATALRRLGAGGIDAVLLDLTLPDSQGQKTFDLTKAHAPTIPIIVLTGLGDEALALKMLRQGAQDYIAKVDLNGSILSRTIRYAIERERSEQKIRRFNEELEERIRERTVELEAANQEMEAFSSSVSHDLRGPLHIIDGFSMMLEENCGRTLGSDGQKYLTRIHDGVRHMANIIEDLLKLSRLGRQELRLETTHLGELLEPILGDIKADIRQRQIEWRVGELPRAECDRDLTKQVFINLIGNSVKYTRQRGAAIIEIGQTSINGEAVIFVRDNGTGFDMTAAGKLFSAFQRFHRHEEFEGTGVGLATVRRIIQRHGGRIWAEAEPDKGATFYFTLGSRQG